MVQGWFCRTTNGLLAEGFGLALVGVGHVFAIDASKVIFRG